MSEGKTRDIYMQYWIKIIFISCIFTQFILVSFDYIFNYMDIVDDISIRRIWNIAREKSIPTWFSSIQAQLLGITVFLIAAVQKPHISRFRFWGWIFIGLFFLWIGIDDVAEIHEKLGGALERLATTESEEQSGFFSFFLQNPSFSWHTFIAPIFAICGLGIAFFLCDKLDHRKA